MLSWNFGKRSMFGISLNPIQSHLSELHYMILTLRFLCGRELKTDPTKCTRCLCDDKSVFQVFDLIFHSILRHMDLSWRVE